MAVDNYIWQVVRRVSHVSHRVVTTRAFYCRIKHVKCRCWVTGATLELKRGRSQNVDIFCGRVQSEYLGWRNYGTNIFNFSMSGMMLYLTDLEGSNCGRIKDCTKVCYIARVTDDNFEFLHVEECGHSSWINLILFILDNVDQMVSANLGPVNQNRKSDVFVVVLAIRVFFVKCSRLGQSFWWRGVCNSQLSYNCLVAYLVKM